MICEIEFVDYEENLNFHLRLQFEEIESSHKFLEGRQNIFGK